MTAHGNERIETMTPTEREFYELKRRLGIIEANFRIVQTTNEILEKEMKILLKNMEAKKK